MSYDNNNKSKDYNEGYEKGFEKGYCKMRKKEHLLNDYIKTINNLNEYIFMLKIERDKLNSELHDGYKNEIKLLPINDLNITKTKPIPIKRIY